MPQKKYGQEGPARPVQLSGEQVNDLIAGKTVEGFEEHSRPRDVSQKEIEALKTGRSINIESLPSIGAVAGFREQSRPHDLTEKDVEAIKAGKEIQLDERPRLKG